MSLDVPRYRPPRPHIPTGFGCRSLTCARVSIFRIPVQTICQPPMYKRAGGVGLVLSSILAKGGFLVPPSPDIPISIPATRFSGTDDGMSDVADAVLAVRPRARVFVAI